MEGFDAVKSRLDAADAEGDRGAVPAAWFADFVENANDILYEHDMNGRITYVNKAAVELSGYAREELLRMNVTQLFTRRELLRTADRISRLFAGEEEGEERATYERELVHRDGRRIVLEVTSRVLYENGRPVRMQGIARDVTRRRQDDESRTRLAELSATLEQKNLLIREIHHRVKNTLQLIASLLNLQSYHITDPVALEKFRDTQNRVRSLAFVHDALYQGGELSRLDCASYLRALATHLLRSYRMSARVEVRIDVHDVALGPDAAVTCGLIVNELVSNSLKHAFPDERGGEIAIALRLAGDDDFELEVRDDGCGLPDDLDARRANTLGFELVNALAGQLGAALEYGAERGAWFRIRFRERRARRAA